MWTRFMDMHSGGSTKIEPYEYIYVNLPEEEAIEWFENTYHRNPNNVTCACCGEDYAISESETLEEATAYDRHCAYDKNGWIEEPRKYYDGTLATLLTVEDYFKQENVLKIVL